MTAKLKVTVDAQVITSLWPAWTRIAIDQEARAREARCRIEETLRETGTLGDMNAELDASLLCVTAAAFALEAFSWRVGKGTRMEGAAARAASCSSSRTGKQVGRLLERLKRSCGVGADAQRWQPAIEWLFGLRDLAVHYNHSPPAPREAHPVGIHTSAERTRYTLEAGEKAVDLIFEVLGVCFTSSGALPEVAEILDRSRGVFLELRARAGRRTGEQSQ